MGESSSGISFDRAAYVDAGPRQACGMCRGPLGSEYWKWSHHVLCAACRQNASALIAYSKTPATFLRAALLGGGVAFACGVGYALFVRLSGWTLALITIGIAYAVARVIRKVSRGVGGVQYQVLATALTYLASAMPYPPTMLQDLEDVFTQPSHLLHTLLLLPLAPIAVMRSPMSLLIMGFGLWEAWRLTRGVATSVDGPFRAAAPAAAPAPERHALPQQTSP